MAIVVCLINNHFAMGKALNEVKACNSEVIAHLQTTISLLELKLEQLSEKTDKHNQVIERTYKLEQMSAQMAFVQEQMDKRIDDITKELRKKYDDGK